VCSALTTARSARVHWKIFNASDIPRCFPQHHSPHSHQRNSIACVHRPRRASLKKELKELPAIHAQKASFKPLPAEPAGKYASDATFFFIFFWDDPRQSLQGGAGNGGDGGDGGDGDGVVIAWGCAETDVKCTSRGTFFFLDALLGRKQTRHASISEMELCFRSKHPKVQ
jgi:hypothetical protein